MKTSRWLVCFSNLQWLLLSLVVSYLDVITKSWVVSNCVLGESIFLLPCVNFYYVYNFGVAFSLFNEFGIKHNGVLLCIMIFIVLMLCGILCCIGNFYTVFLKVAYAMVIGGASGNLIDRIRYGVVIDFIDFHIWDWHFPIFNIADLSIFIGVCIILLCHYK